MSVIPFNPRPRQPRVELKLLGTLGDGRLFFVLDLVDEDGCLAQVWDGNTYAAARAAARGWAAEGTPVIDTVGGGQ